MIRLTIKTGTRLRDGGARPPEVYEGKDEEEVVDAWNASGAWNYLSETGFRQTLAEMGGIELPASDDELLEAIVKTSGGNVKLEKVDSVAGRITSALLSR